jgi:hypothetical protein
MAINFSIPNIPSFTKTKPDGKNIIFVPDVKYLSEFSKGDLGIADAINKKTISNNISSAKNKNEAETYLKNAGGSVDSLDNYLNNGKYIVPVSAIKLSPSKNQSGLKALEKSVIQSIFDTQKPYMELIGQLSNVLITVEDVIARALALPAKSLKPATNPRALGYKKNKKVSTKNELAKLKSLSDNDTNSEDPNKIGTIYSKNGNLDNYHYEIESTVYSTGTFKEGVDYTYEYIDINNIEPIISNTNQEEEDEISKLPKTLVVAVFDEKGNMISDSNIRDNVYNLSWLKTSKKWFGNFNYLSDNEVDNINLYKNYYEGYTRDNLPVNMRGIEKNKIVNRVNELNSTNNNKNIRDQIDGYKKEGFFPSLKLKDDTSVKSMEFYVNRKAFAAKKININGVNTWIDPESDYEFKLIKCDATPKDNDDNLTKDLPFSDSIYGSDSVSDIGQIYRNSNSDGDNDKIQPEPGKKTRFGPKDSKTYYILEGILADNNNQSFDAINKVDNGNSSFKYYRKPAFFGVIKQFIKLIIQIATKITPAVKTIADIASNPTNFVTTIMTGNLGDNSGTKGIKFMFFSSEFVKKFGSLKLLDSKGKKSVINNSVLKNYVVLKKDGTPKFLLGGSGNSHLKNKKIGNSVNGDMAFTSFSSVYPVEPKSNNLSDKLDYSNLKFTSYNESETIDYIGGYNPNITYDYIYVTKIVLNLLAEAQDLEDAGDYDKALSKYNEAHKLDPNNKTISDKIDDISKKVDTFGGNTLFSFILNMITLPMEIVLGIVEQIVKIISGFSSPTTLKDSIADLVSFKIFPGGLKPLDFFTPIGMLKLAKIEFNIALFISWVSGILVSPLASYDLNKIIKLPFVTKFPTYTTKEFKSLIFGHGTKINMLPLKMLNSILRIFEGIINAIISFFWALMGLAGLYKKPKLKFTKDSNSDISGEDLQALLNGTYTDVVDPNAEISPNYDFIYNIKLPDGRTVRQLDSIELENFILQNTNFQYQNNF